MVRLRSFQAAGRMMVSRRVVDRVVLSLVLGEAMVVAAGSELEGMVLAVMGFWVSFEELSMVVIVLTIAVFRWGIFCGVKLWGKSC